MRSYRVEFTTAAAKELRKLEPSIRRHILSGIAGLELEPRPAGCKKLVGEKNAWRIRVGDYRALYEIVDSVLIVTVVKIAHRREAYY